MSFLQVASWNIEHLSGQPRAARPQTAYALADHIEMAGIDLIALQEMYLTPEDDELRLFPNQPVIPSHAQSERRNADLDAVCYLLEEHRRAAWTYLILPNRSEDDDSQLVAVMWNTTRLSLDTVRALEVEHHDDGDSLWDRKPHLLEFTSSLKVWRRNAENQWEQQDENRRISVVPLHMKSNFNGVAQNRRVRMKEAVTLCNAIEAIAGSFDPSLILLGDTNILRNDEPALEVFTDRGYIDLNNTDSKTYWSKNFPEAPFDRIFIAKDRPEFKYSRQYVLRSSDPHQHDRFLSDHFMIKMSVKDYVDDADPRPEP